MLLMSVRVRPWSCLCCLRSEGRVTRRLPSPVSTVIAAGRERVRVPLGPVTVMTGPSRAISTPAGTRTGWRPIRDIVVPLPDVREDFAAELGLASLRAGHDPLAGADDDDAQAAQDPGDVRLAGVDAEAGLADALEPGEDRCLAVDVLEVEREDGVDPVAALAEGGDEALIDEDACDLELHPGCRHDHLEVVRARRIADTREHVRDRIGDVHGRLTSSTSSRPGPRPRGRAPGSRCGRAQTGACRHGADHTAVSYTH